MKLKILYIVCIGIMMVSCGSSKSILYLQDAEKLPENSIPQTISSQNMVVMPGDLIDIEVNSINTETVKPFNKQSSSTDGMGSGGTPSTYLVDNNGDITFPVLGKLHIGGMNKEQISDCISSQLTPRYLSSKPTIDIRFKNFKVSVLGEVKTPGVYMSNNECMNVLEAIAQAGDLTINGVRDNIMIIRSNGDGTRTVHLINLKDKNLILSPYYNLQQNDVIYVQPNKSKARQSWQIPPALTLTLSSVGTLISIATLIVTLTK